MAVGIALLLTGPSTAGTTFPILLEEQPLDASTMSFEHSVTLVDITTSGEYVCSVTSLIPRDSELNLFLEENNIPATDTLSVTVQRMSIYIVKIRPRNTNDSMQL